MSRVKALSLLLLALGGAIVAAQPALASDDYWSYERHLGPVGSSRTPVPAVSDDGRTLVVGLQKSVVISRSGGETWGRVETPSSTTGPFLSATSNDASHIVVVPQGYGSVTALTLDNENVWSEPSVVRSSQAYPLGVWLSSDGTKAVVVWEESTSIFLASSPEWRRDVEFSYPNITCCRSGLRRQGHCL